MKKILIATQKPFAASAVERIKTISQKTGYELILLEKYSDSEELKMAIKNVDAVIIRSDKITADVLHNANSLKIIVRAGAGYDNVDLTASTEKGVVVMNTPGQNANAVAELAIGMMIYSARNNFSPKPGIELKGKNLGLHAYGNVGKRVSEIAKCFGMTIYAYDPYLEKDYIEKDGVTALDSKEELYSTCHFISLHLPVNKDTLNAINYNLLTMMPQNATLLNTARKEVVCEESLIKIFTSRDDFTYVSDIAPDNAEEIRQNFGGRYFFTPKKMGAQTIEANENAGVAAINQIINFFENNDITFQVNK